MKSVILVLFLLFLQPGAEPEIKLKITPSTQLSPGTVRIDCWIQPNPDNRGYKISWSDESGELGRHGKDLDGDNEPTLFPPFYVSNLSPGQYIVEGMVKRIVMGKTKEYTTKGQFEVK